MNQSSKSGIYILLISLHGLIRSRDVELGRDADTGGQVKYVLEMADHLSQRPEVARVDLFTRMIRDKRVSPDYSVQLEPINDKARIVRISCGGRRYIRKELLWPHLDEYIDRCLRFLKGEPFTPFLIHGHYADGGYVAKCLADYLGAPFAYTGHSLGRPKYEKLLQDGLSEGEIEKKYAISHRIAIEEEILGSADFVFTSTRQEVEQQYGLYKHSRVPDFTVNPPGLDLERFFPYNDPPHPAETGGEVRNAMEKELNRYFTDPGKPLILALCRPDKRKNVSALIRAFGESEALQAVANLAIFMGIRRNFHEMEENERAVLIDALVLMDHHSLYGKMALPKKPGFQFEVPELYRIAARSGGVFVNPALTEPFGLTLLESAACGLPIVATNDGGPVDIVKNCDNGLLVDVSHPESIAGAILKILNDREVWNTYSENGIRNVRVFYSWESSTRRYLETLSPLQEASLKRSAAIRKSSPVARKLMRVQKMVICDIDNTLTGNAEAMSRLFEVLNQSREEVAFGVATGRTIDSAIEHLQENGCPMPDILITSVGSEIYYSGKAFQDTGWASHIERHWNRENIRRHLTKLPFLRPQEPETERRFKISYYLEPDNEHLQLIHDTLTGNKVRYNLIYSHQRYLDILPQRASKGKALRYLSFKWNLPLERFLVAGDSGNDEEMLRGEPYGIVVGNYSSEMEVLRGKWRIYFAREHHAAGVLEGIRHYRFLES